MLVFYIGGTDIIAGAPGALSTGAFALFFLCLRRLFSPMRRVGKSANKYQLTKASSERVFGLLDQEPTVTDPPEPHRPERIEGRVSFDSVSFAYEDGQPVLREVSLDVPAGGTVGLAGPSGAGKSTLLKPLARLYDPDTGAVRIDGIDVREYDLQALREEVAVVEQNPYLFAGSVAENIAYGDRNLLAAEWDEEGDGDGNDDGTGADTGDRDATARDRIVEAARAAEAHAFIEALPEGYDTLVGERGVKLSGGQRQWIAIARALLNDPAIIVFDEATSDVDTETKELIQASLDRLIEDRTAFVIAHRLSTIKAADRIVVMAEGEITESGTHAELLTRESDYAALWSAQADTGRSLTTAGD